MIGSWQAAGRLQVGLPSYCPVCYIHGPAVSSSVRDMSRSFEYDLRWLGNVRYIYVAWIAL